MSATASPHYLFSDPLFFDRLERTAGWDDCDRLLRDRLGDCASVETMGIWTRCFDRPIGELPEHGWKLHVSAKPSEVTEVLNAVIDEYLVDPFCFKAIRSHEIATLQLSRWWARGGAGKAIAIYPLNTDHAHDVAERLTKRLAGFEGPHILTDRRFPGSATVQYRYGTFRRPPGVDDQGHGLSVVTGPNGETWADDRSPQFSMPSWIAEDPFAAVEPVQPANDFLQRYKVKNILHRSAAGGVYLATAPDGAEVVLKEARPNTAFAPDGSDATQRLRHEFDVLRAVEPTGLAPTPIELTEVWEHTFLVESYVPGITLQVWIARNNPYAQGFTDAARIDAYRSRVQGLVGQLRSALGAFLDAGIVYGDVSLRNIIVDSDDALRLVDLEGGRERDADPADHQWTKGYSPLAGSAAYGDDEALIEFGIAAIEAACLSTRNVLLGLDVELFGRTLRHAAEQLGWPYPELAARLEPGAPGISAAGNPPPPGSAGLVADVVRHLRAAATPDRTDRLFPGDPAMFATNPLSIAYGAAGVLRTLRQLDGGVDPGHVEWVNARLDADPALPPGLYLGSAGIGLSLLELGERDRGIGLLRRSARATDLPAGVATGWSGVGLAMLGAARLTGDQHWLDEADRIGARLSASAEDDGTGLWWRPDEPVRRSLGYLHGSSGVASFLLELSEATGNDQMLALGRRALQFDLQQGRVRANGGLGFGSYAGAHAFEPYVLRGGAGVGMAVARYVRATGDPELAELLDLILLGVAMPFALNPGLFQGMSGIVECLLDAQQALPDNPRIRPSIDVLVADLLSLRAPQASGTAFPGDGLHRFSCDVATGSAGIAALFHRLATGSDTLDVRYGLAGSVVPA